MKEVEVRNCYFRIVYIKYTFEAKGVITINGSGVASLTSQSSPAWARVLFSSIFLKFQPFLFIFLTLIKPVPPTFVPIFALRVGDSQTR